MIGPAARELETLPAGHPCEKCEVRGRALCSVLDCEKLAQFKRLGSTLRLRPGQTLFREGDSAARVFSITRGSLKLYRMLPDGRRQIVGFLFAGDFLGVTVDDVQAFTAELIEDGELCSFARERFANFVAENRPIEQALYRKAAHELVATQQQLVILGRKSARARIASFLLLLAERNGPLGDRKGGMLKLPMSRIDIADYLGLTKETVSRALSDLRARRVIRLRTLHEVDVLDWSVLERLAEN